MENKLNKDIVEAIFYSNQKKGFIDTAFGKKTEIGLTQMIENDSYSTEEIAKAIFENNESKEKIKTGYGDKTLKGLTEMIEDARPDKYENGGELGECTYSVGGL